ncbi:MAG TPA: hypothetical protein VJ953_16765 [Saprospiraceae bacterium]|nr:hypothetical protein [Saprospiraceae bacterium]
MLQKRLLILFFAIFTVGLSAQTVEDALRYSSFDPSGTARFLGAGSALGPLGADLSVTGTNPAGIAQYRKSEFSITPTLFLSGANAELLPTGNNVSDSRTAFNLHNIGVVITSQPRRARKWKTMNMAITLNNIANYNRRFSYSGATTGSIAQRWQEFANDPNIGLSIFETDLAASAGVIYDIDDNPDDYEIDYEGFENQLLEKNHTVLQSGSISELSFAFAANYDERLMIGFSVGLPIVYFEYDSDYRESDEGSGPGGNVPYFESLEYNDRFTTTGGGVNAKLGLVYRLTQAIRLSGAVHTPTAFSFEDEYETELINNYFADPDESGDFVGGDATSTGLFEYRLNSPWRYFAGAGFIIGKMGFISAEAELVDYNNSRFRYDGFQADEDAINFDIQDRLTDVLNLRIGGEFALDQFRFRLGYGTYPSAYIGDDTRRSTYSGGVGFRHNNIFLDMGYRYTSFDEQFFPYGTQQAVLQEVQVDNNLHRLLLTFGVKF